MGNFEKRKLGEIMKTRLRNSTLISILVMVITAVALVFGSTLALGNVGSHAKGETDTMPQTSKITGRVYTSLAIGNSVTAGSPNVAHSIIC